MSALTTAQICALLLGGAAVGSVGTVAVKERPAVARKKPVAVSRANIKPVADRERPFRYTQTAREPVCIMEMPLVGSPFALDAAPLPSLSGGAGVWLEQRSPDGGLVFLPRQAPNPFIPAPAVTEPPAWAMAIMGFGLMGVALRRRKANA